MVHGLLGVLGSIAFALALGAVWMALQMHLPSARYWFAILVGLALGRGVRAWFVPWQPAAMLLAGLGTVLASLYMQSLSVGLHLAAVMGLDRWVALRRAGAEMLVALAWAATDEATLVALALGVLAALWMAARKRRPASSPLTHHQAP